MIKKHLSQHHSQEPSAATSILTCRSKFRLTMNAPTDAMFAGFILMLAMTFPARNLLAQNSEAGDGAKPEPRESAFSFGEFSVSAY
jgi:hypothetical protein